MAVSVPTFLTSRLDSCALVTWMVGEARKMGRRSSRGKLTLDKETLGRLTLSPDELQRVAGGAYVPVRPGFLASGSKLCQSGA